MENIIFRAISDPSNYPVNEFVYGNYIKATDELTTRHYIASFEIVNPPNFHLIKIETLGMCLNRKDINGKDVYQGDILKLESDETELSVIEWDDDKKRFVIGVYDFDVTLGEGGQEVYSDHRSRVDDCELWNDLTDQEVIGNVHQNLNLIS